MKERSIRLRDEQVCAILDGRMTEVRRPIAPADIAALRLASGIGNRSASIEICPLGRPGDRLWVQECWTLEDLGEDGKRVVWRADREAAWVRGRLLLDEHYLDSDYQPTRWRSSSQMPRRASRITLEITGVRVEQVQDITEDGARREGVEPRFPYYREGFAAAWDGTYGSWNDNPWVWVISFRRLS